MTYVGFCILLVLNFVLLPCKGRVIPPSNKNVTVLPNSTARLKWTSTGDTSRASLFWFFTRRGGSEEEIAVKSPNQPAKISNSSLPRVAIENPLTLVLKNIDESYNGRYRLNVVGAGGGDASVELLVAAKPSVTITSCSDPTAVNEGNDVTCVCKSQGGVPKANVTWYDKNDAQIGNTSFGENMLTLTNVTKLDSGRYTCKAQSFTLIDEKSFEVKVTLNYKPINTTIKVPKEAYVGEKVTITCESDGLPAPTFTIFHNDTARIVSNQATYTKDNVRYSDAGMYTCIAKNKLGIDTDSGNLTIKEKRPSTKSTTKKPTTQSTQSTQSTPSKTTERAPGGADGGDSALSTGAIVGIVVGVLLLVVVVVIVVYFCHKSKEKDGRNRGNIDPIAGNHYELENEEPSPGDNAYDSVGPVGESGSKKKAPEKDSLPPVYAAVDKNNRQGNTLYASLDTDALKRESKKEPANRTPQTEYASIDFAKNPDVPKADLV